MGAQSEKEEKGWGRKLAGAKADSDRADWTTERRSRRCAKTNDRAGRRTARPQGARGPTQSQRGLNRTPRGVVLSGPTPSGVKPTLWAGPDRRLLWA